MELLCISKKLIVMSVLSQLIRIMLRVILKTFSSVHQKHCVSCIVRNFPSIAETIIHVTFCITL